MNNNSFGEKQNINSPNKVILLGIQIGEFFHNIKDPTNETNSKKFFYQQSITALLSVGNQEINSFHFLFKIYIYILYIASRRDGKCCIHRSENNSLEAESEYESLSTDSSWKTNALSSSLLSQFAPSINS